MELEVESLGGGGGGEHAGGEGVEELLAEAVYHVDGGDVEDLGVARREFSTNGGGKGEVDSTCRGG